MARLVFDHVTVQYPIYNSRTQSLRHQLVAMGTGGRIAHGARRITTVTALNDVSFELVDGDSIGLIGHNGSGKTTLLRTMAGIYAPVSGTVIREGRVSTIIEVGAGMDAELSGYENIVRMGLLLEMSHPEIAAAVPGIEELTELGDYLAMPVRTYSKTNTLEPRPCWLHLHAPTKKRRTSMTPQHDEDALSMEKKARRRRPSPQKQ